jgi:hypothetical protein
VEGATDFAVGKRPAIKVSEKLSANEGRENRYRTTLAHELRHAVFHDEAFQLRFASGDLLGDRGASIIVCKRETMIDAPQVDWMEWQASYASCAFLMPRDAMADLLRPLVVADWARKRVSNEIAAMVGKRLVVVSEANEGAQLNAARIKSLASRDTQRARFLYHDSFEFTPTQHFWLAFNDAPKVSDDSDGFWRRVALVPYEQTFVRPGVESGEPEPGALHADPTLDEHLIEHELPGILAWAVRGCLQWQDHTMKPFPEVIEKATSEYRDSENELGNWIEARCSLDPERRGKPMELFNSYRDWAEGMDIPVSHRLDHRTFGTKLKNRFSQVQINGSARYKGIDLKPFYEPEGHF